MILYRKAGVSNLWRNAASGIYYARTTVKGKDTWRSLHTDLKSVARLKLPRMLAALRAASGALRGSVTLGECAAIYMQRKTALGRKGMKLKPRSIAYRSETIAMIRRLWAGFDQRPAGLVTKQDCLHWAARARRSYQATRFNGMVESLRGILGVAVELGALETNPALDVYRARVEVGERFVPSREQFTEILQRLDAVKSRHAAALSVRGYAFTGIRPEEARHIEPHDFDEAARTLRVRVTKNGEPRTIYLIDQALELFAGELPKLLRAFRKSPKKALTTVARELGLDDLCRERKLRALSPYSFRKLYETRLLECGVDIIAAAADAGHRDQGRTLLKHYVARRPEHVRRQMRKVVV